MISRVSNLAFCAAFFGHVDFDARIAELRHSRLKHLLEHVHLPGKTLSLLADIEREIAYLRAHDPALAVLYSARELKEMFQPHDGAWLH